MKKRVLMLRSSVGVFGAETVILELAHGLLDSQFEAIVGVIENQNAAWQDLAKTAREAGYGADTFRCRSPFDFRTVRQIRRYLADRQIDIVHAHGYKANFYALMSTRFTDIACVATCHPWTETTYSAKARLYTYLDKSWLRGMQRVVAISEAVKDELYNCMPESRVDFIPNGIDISRFQHLQRSIELSAELGLGRSDKVIGTIGRLVPEKGYDRLLQAFARLRNKASNIKLLFVGDGPLRLSLREQAGQLGIEKDVIFVGLRQDIPQLLAIMDIFALSSVSEGLPMVILEAMAAARPIIATTVGYIPRVLSHGTNALLVPPDAYGEMADAMYKILTDKLLAQRLSDAARNHVSRYFSCEEMAKRYAAMYENLLSRRN